MGRGRARELVRYWRFSFIEDLADELFELLKDAENGAFALDCFMLEGAAALRPPAYVAEGLSWLQTALGPEIRVAADVPEGAI